jgi:hypothetical protein
MNKTAFISTLAAGTLALGLGFVIVTNTSQPKAVAADAIDPAMTQALSPRLQQSQATTDALPKFLQAGTQELPGIQASSVRQLGETEDAQFWLGINEDGETCLINLLSGPDQLASMTCQTAAVVWKQGLALQVDTKAGSVRAYFLPTGYATEIDGYVKVGDQLLVGHPSQASKTITVAPTGKSRAMRSADGVSFGSAPLELPWMPAPQYGNGN